MIDIWVDVEWFSLKEAAAFLETDSKKLRSWVKDGSLVALANPQDGKQRIPKDFLVKRESYTGPLDTLKGTVTLLRDCGLSDEETVRWLFESDDSLGESPIRALLAGKKKAVRRVAGTLAL